MSSEKMLNIRVYSVYIYMHILGSSYNSLHQHRILRSLIKYSTWVNVLGYIALPHVDIQRCKL